MRTLIIRPADLQKAIGKAKKVHDDWQAELIEILLIPKIYKRWLFLNKKRNARIERHSGRPYKGISREDADKVTNWGEFAGYTLHYYSGLNWNLVREDYYCHSPSTCWDGIRRETTHWFVEALRLAYYSLLDNRTPSYSIQDTLREAGIRLETA